MVDISTREQVNSIVMQYATSLKEFIIFTVYIFMVPMLMENLIKIVT